MRGAPKDFWITTLRPFGPNVTFTDDFGDYSVDLFRNIDLHGDPPSRALFDMAAVAIVKNSSWAISSQIPSPTLVDGMWVERQENKRKITLWENFNKEKIIQDFYSSMENYVLAK